MALPGPLPQTVYQQQQHEPTLLHLINYKKTNKSMPVKEEVDTATPVNDNN